MQLRTLFLLCFSLAFTKGFSQSNIVATATRLIAGREYDSANALLDSLLKQNPDNVDAIMMKGNVLLNQTTESLSADTIITERDESIFYTDLDPGKEPTLPADVTLAIDSLWRICLVLDTSRVDIRKGLCTIYAMSGMTQKLKAEIIEVKKSEADIDGGQVFRMAEYARKLKARGRFNEAIDIYKFIASLYPESAGLRCDIASEYFYEGVFNESLSWLDSCFQHKNIDETSYLNGAFIYSELGYFDNALSVLNTYSEIYDRQMGKFYHGLKLFSEANSEYLLELKDFVSAVDSNFYSDEVRLSKNLIAAQNLSYSDYSQLISDYEIPDYYKTLIYTRCIRQFNDSCAVSISYGLFLSQLKNYSAALQFLQDMESCPNPDIDSSYVLLVYGYTLYRLNIFDKASTSLKSLSPSENDFVSQASEYFLMKIYEESDAKDLANSLKEKLVNSETQTKYSLLAKLVE